MSAIPVSLTEKAFNEFVLPHLSVAKRGYISKIPLYKIFNYILYRLHTGCQWYQLPIAELKDALYVKLPVSSALHLTDALHCGSCKLFLQ